MADLISVHNCNHDTLRGELVSSTGNNTYMSSIISLKKGRGIMEDGMVMTKTG